MKLFKTNNLNVIKSCM